MLKVMMAAPFEANGRYQGGINAIVNRVLQEEETLSKEQIDLIPFNTCRIARDNKSTGKLSLGNIKNFVRVYKDVVHELHSASPDVFYMHSSVGIALLKDLLVLRHVKRATGCKTVLHIHFADIEKILTGKGVLDNWMMSALKKYVDGIVFLSAQTMEQFVSRGIQRDKCHVIYNFSTLSYEEAELFSGERNSIREFLFVGSIDDRKGIFDAMEVLSQIDVPFVLHVCGGFGDDESKARFEEYQSKLGKRLQFHGFVAGEEKREIFRQADVLVLPSYGEGLPVVILEAFSAGCAVITTNVGAIPEIVGEQNGVIIKPGDLQALRNAFCLYLDEEEGKLVQQKRNNCSLAQAYTLRGFIRNIAQVCHVVSAGGKKNE